MKLNKHQRAELQRVLMSAFPTPNALSRMVSLGMDQNLASISEPGSLEDLVFRLIQWAEAHGRTLELIAEAHSQNPGNAELAAFAARNVSAEAKVDEIQVTINRMDHDEVKLIVELLENIKSGERYQAPSGPVLGSRLSEIHGKLRQLNLVRCVMGREWESGQEVEITEYGTLFLARMAQATQEKLQSTPGEQRVVQQSVTGNGNIFSGTGDVTVNRSKD